MAESKKLTKENKIIELYNTPIGRDTMDKVLLQLGIPTTAITNPVVANIKLSTVMKLAEYLRMKWSPLYMTMTSLMV